MKEDHGRRWPFVSQGERTQEKLTLPLPGSQTSSFQEREKSTCAVEAGASLWYLPCSREITHLVQACVHSVLAFPADKKVFIILGLTGGRQCDMDLAEV